MSIFLLLNLVRLSLRTADVFPVVASLPPKNIFFFGGREGTTRNASAVRRLSSAGIMTGV